MKAHRIIQGRLSFIFFFLLLEKQLVTVALQRDCRAVEMLLERAIGTSIVPIVIRNVLHFGAGQNDLNHPSRKKTNRWKTPADGKAKYATDFC